MIHTSHFQDDKPATEDDVTMLLHACHFVGGIEQVVVTGGREEISGTKHFHLVWSIGSKSIFILSFNIQETDRSQDRRPRTFGTFCQFFGRFMAYPF